MRTSVLSLTLGISLLLLGTTACSSSSTATPSASVATVSSMASGTSTQALAPPTSAADQVLSSNPSVSSMVPASTASSSSGPASPSSSAASASSAAQPAGGSVSDGIGHRVNICALMPAATAAKVSTVAVTVAKEDDTPSYKLYTCIYNNVSAAGASSHPIAGLGDKAQSSPLGVEATFGNVSIQVSGMSSTSGAEAVIRAIQPKL